MCINYIVGTVTYSMFCASVSERNYKNRCTVLLWYADVLHNKALSKTCALTNEYGVLYNSASILVIIGQFIEYEYFNCGNISFLSPKIRLLLPKYKFDAIFRFQNLYDTTS